ncbi:MAG: (deoxy)nucleoside triphosphate pyrophosphohydrolase [Bacillaceae bacterium]|nr:(deoxy)nucleoside triphosphate pyrophosphohydrolase [Bacillaceae bacterium]
MENVIRVVGAVIFNDDQEILCALRSSNMSQPTLWEFPGGKMKDGETPEEALIREVYEELNCVIKVEELMKDVLHEYPDVIVNLLTYKAKIEDGKPSAGEHAQITWVPINQLITLEWAPADLPTVDFIITHYGS